MYTYITPDHPYAFVDWQPETDKVREMRLANRYTQLCQKCQGHGGWNLLLNQYDLNGKENTAENRHKFSHFRSHCMACNGWGYVHESQTCPGHEWVHVRNTGNCLNLHRCSVCGKEWEIDSSD